MKQVGEKTVITWFYSEDSQEEGHYPQVGGKSSSQDFKDYYLRCVCLFYASARRMLPEAKLIFYSNVRLSAMTSQVSLATRLLLGKLQVEVVTIPYTHSPPLSFSKSWRNQFYIFDILAHLEQRQDPDALYVILDSDVVWHGQQSAASFWDTLSHFGSMTYSLDLDPGLVQNGLSQLQLEKILDSLQESNSLIQVPYCGGEFVAVSKREVAELNANIQVLYNALMALHLENTLFAFEEAHILSMAYALLGWTIGSANPYVKRIWTQPLMFKNATLEDLGLLLLHVPAEKKYGVRRIYNEFFTDGDPSKYLSLSSSQHNDLISNQLGIPRNRARKWLFDITYALGQKLRQQIVS